MRNPDLNLLLTLRVLLAEGSVGGAARRLRKSPSAMSHALARLRKVTGDPLFVRSGRGIVATPRALELREQVGTLVDAAETILQPRATADLRAMSRTFTVRTSDGFVENFGAALLRRVSEEAPGLRLRFVQKPDRDASPLREGIVDLETGVVSELTAPELRMRALFRDRFVGVVHGRHPLAKGRVSASSYAMAGHVLVARRGTDKGIGDEALARLGLRRDIVATVSGFASALALARSTDLVATVPERHTAALRAGLHTFALPFATGPITVSMLWHPRMDADPAHKWLRACLREVCASSRRASLP